MKLSALLYNELVGKILLNFFPHKSKVKPDEVSKVIKELIASDCPAFIGRFGSSEIRGMLLPQLPFIFQFFIKKKVLKTMVYHAGFFPFSYQQLEKFSKLSLNDLNDIDILASWRIEELFYRKKLEKVLKIELGDLEPFLLKEPWSEALYKKKVLVVHPFVESIKKQYETKRQYLFQDSRVLPEFEKLITIKSIQTIGGNKSGYADWFEALECMKDEITNTDFDIALLGCGAYGMPLCAHIKRMGKKAIYMGGVLQMLFGIKGKRWVNDSKYQNIINEHFVTPGEEERPANWEESKDLIDSNSVGGYW